MLLLCLSAAFAVESATAPPPEPDTSWKMALPGLEGIDDPMGVEAVFAQYGVDSARTDLVSAERYGQATGTQRIRVHRLNLGDGTVSERVTLRPQRGCAHLPDSEWSGGALRVHAAAGRGEEEPVAPSVVIVRDNPEIGSLVVMAPGDTVETRQVRENGHLLSETVRVRRNAELLELRRDGDEQVICSSTLLGEASESRKAP